MIPPYSYGIPRVPQYSGIILGFLVFVYKALTFFGLTSQLIQLTYKPLINYPYPKSISTLGLTSSDFARHYFRNLF